MVVLPLSSIVSSGSPVLRPTSHGTIHETAHPTHGLGDVLSSPNLPKISMVIAAYHGLRRNRGSVFWGLAWGVAGRVFPLLVPALAVAQGYAEEKRCP